MAAPFDINRYGYVEISVSGAGIEKFLNLCASDNIRLRFVSHIGPDEAIVTVSVSDFYRLRPILRLSGCRLRIRKRSGLLFIFSAMAKRKGLVIGAFIFLCLFVVCANIVFSVEIESPYELSFSFRDQMLAKAEELGIKQGAYLPSLDLESAEADFLRSFHNIMWVDIVRSGAGVKISIVERTDADEKDIPNNPGNIIASKDCVITDILVRKGQAMVEMGEEVKKGQLLVAGIDAFGDPIAASAIIRGSVVYESEASCPTVSREHRETGRNKRIIAAKWLDDDQLILWGEKEVPFDDFVSERKEYPLVLWRKSILPVEIVIIDYREQKEQVTNLGVDLARKNAESAAEKALLRDIPAGAVVAERSLVYLDNEDADLQRVCLRMTILENTGEFREF